MPESSGKSRRNRWHNAWIVPIGARSKSMRASWMRRSACFASPAWAKFSASHSIAASRSPGSSAQIEMPSTTRCNSRSASARRARRRSRKSRAAASLKVATRIAPTSGGACPSSNRRRYSAAIVQVLPVPALASIRTRSGAASDSACQSSVATAAFIAALPHVRATGSCAADRARWQHARRFAQTLSRRRIRHPGNRHRARTRRCSPERTFPRHR